MTTIIGDPAGLGNFVLPSKDTGKNAVILHELGWMISERRTGGGSSYAGIRSLDSFSSRYFCKSSGV